MQWYLDSLLAGADRTDLDRESHIIVGIIPSIVEKVVVPFFVGKSYYFNIFYSNKIKII